MKINELLENHQKVKRDILSEAINLSRDWYFLMQTINNAITRSIKFALTPLGKFKEFQNLNAVKNSQNITSQISDDIADVLEGNILSDLTAAMKQLSPNLADVRIESMEHFENAKYDSKTRSIIINRNYLTEIQTEVDVWVTDFVSNSTNELIQSILADIPNCLKIKVLADNVRILASGMIHELVHSIQGTEQHLQGIEDEYYLSRMSDPKKSKDSKARMRHLDGTQYLITRKKDEFRQLMGDKLTAGTPRAKSLHRTSQQEISAISHNVVFDILTDLDLTDINEIEHKFRNNPEKIKELFNDAKHMIPIYLRKELDLIKPLNPREVAVATKVAKKYFVRVYQELDYVFNEFSNAVKYGSS